ncbi:MAG: thioredoxin domain-containing protein [Fibrobacterales bacterium]
MKKLIFSAAIILVSIMACQAEGDKKSSSNGDVAKIQEELELIKWYLKSKGASLASIKQQKMAEETAHVIPEGTSPVMGAKDPKITIVEFSDFQCPYCARATEQVQRIMEKYPEQVRLVFKHFPLSFHKKAPAAHAASMAAHNQGKFFEYRNALAPQYKNLSEATFIDVAKKIGLNMEQFKKDMVLNAASNAVIKADMALGSSVGVRGTPSFYINGKKHTKAMSLGVIAQMLNK